MLYQITIPQFTKMLQNLNRLLDKGAAQAEAKKFETEVLLNARLAPDQFPLTRQIQIACDTAKLCAARLAGQEAPVHDDKEKTLPELKARIDSVIQYLGKFSENDFKGAEERKITQARWEGKYLNGWGFPTRASRSIIRDGTGLEPPPPAASAFTIPMATRSRSAFPAIL